MGSATRIIRNSIASLPSIASRFTVRPRSSLGNEATALDVGKSFFVRSARYSASALSGGGGGGDEMIYLPALNKSEGRPFKIKGTIKNNYVSLLLSMGSPVSFIDSQLANKLNLECLPTNANKFWANGQSIISSTTCPNITWEMGGNSFKSDFRCLDLAGKSDMILGTDWMHKYSPIVFRFAENEVSITSEGKEILLQAEIV